LSEAAATVSALVLAGRRGEGDPLADSLAAAGGAAHHSLIDVCGVPMLVRVVRVLRASPSIGAVAVCIDDPGALDCVAELERARREGWLSIRQAAESPSRSVAEGIAAAGDGPVLVTTADHALLAPEMIARFLDRGTAEADVWVGVVEESVVRGRYPETRRTYLRLGPDRISGANLFLFRSPDAIRAAEFWVRAERYRKQPWRLAGVFGVRTLLAFLLRRLDLDGALARVSDAMGVRVRAVRLPFAEAAIDVDRPADLALAERILAARDATSPRGR